MEVIFQFNVIFVMQSALVLIVEFSDFITGGSVGQFASQL
jgi:hypothetical protein